LARAARAEQAGVESRGRRDRGEGLGRPAIGAKYVSRVRTLPNGRERRYLMQVPDPDERQIIKLIRGWREQDPPLAWDASRRRLNQLELPTRSGTAWTTARVRRAHDAEGALQRREAAVARASARAHEGSPGPTPATGAGHGEMTGSG